ncbi:hypothetical protein ACCO45_010584 [Purpureocillium lilacinum]|uniref:Uncharacterized protein n=1 Tax=Purpureocillium lilacinum TaxID=33203 RepID=A0ACC4DF86_PURLI
MDLFTIFQVYGSLDEPSSQQSILGGVRGGFWSGSRPCRAARCSAGISGGRALSWAPSRALPRPQAGVAGLRPTVRHRNWVQAQGLNVTSPIPHRSFDCRGAVEAPTWIQDGRFADLALGISRAAFASFDGHCVAIVRPHFLEHSLSIPVLLLPQQSLLARFQAFDPFSASSLITVSAHGILERHGRRRPRDKEASSSCDCYVSSLGSDLIHFHPPAVPQAARVLPRPRSPSLLDDGPPTLLQHVLTGLNKYKAAFSRPIDSRYDIVLLGGATGSLFSLLQAVASPVIGRLSDRYGRRKALLTSMCGNILSVLLWVAAVDFRTFIASRVVGGLSEGNVQLTTAMASDISDEATRGQTMAIIGACFSIAFTFGPGLGAWLSTISIVSANPFATAAGISLVLIVTETVYLYLCLPETLPALTGQGTLLYAVHFFFILFFSGMESSLSFMTYELFGFTSGRNGRLLGYIGFVASILQGGVTRRLPPLLSVRIGVIACLASFFLLGRITTVRGLYAAATCLAVTSATVVSSLNALTSFEAREDERGSKLGVLRSWGQLGRGLGPILFTSVYWWAGREVAYTMGATGVAVVAATVLMGLKTPKRVASSKATKAR